MASNSREVRTLPGPIENYIARMRNIGAAGLKFTIAGESPVQNGLMFLLSHSISFSSWGETIKVYLIAQGNQTVVDVYSECALPTQIVDWGKNKENVAKVFGYLMQGGAQQSYYQPQQNCAQPQQNAVVCPNCGKRLDPSFVFCDNCGTRVK